MTDQIIIQGALEFHSRGVGQEYVWKKRFCVLRGRSQLQEARFDWYETEDDSKIASPNHHPKRSLYLQQIDIVDIVQGHRKKNVFQVHMKDPSAGDNLLFCAPSEVFLHQWVDCFTILLQPVPPSPDTGQRQLCRSMSSGDSPPINDDLLYSMSDDYESYTAEVTETEAAQRSKLSGTYELRLHELNICLLKGSSEKHIWPYRYIRRYGRSRTTFTFEAGRKSLSGEGLLTFKVPDGSEVFTAVSKRTKAMRDREESGEFNLDSKSLGRSAESLLSPTTPTTPTPPIKPKPVPKPRISSDSSPLPSLPKSPPPTAAKPVPATKPAPPRIPQPRKMLSSVSSINSEISPKCSPPPTSPPPLPLTNPPRLNRSPKTSSDQPDSGFGTMDSDILLPTKSLSDNYPDYEDYVNPCDNESASDSDIYTEPYETQQASSMSKLVQEMNVGDKRVRYNQQDSYDHIDLRQASARPHSGSNQVKVEIEDDSHLYGDLSICKTDKPDEDDGYCSVNASK